MWDRIPASTMAKLFMQIVVLIIDKEKYLVLGQWFLSYDFATANMSNFQATCADERLWWGSRPINIFLDHEVVWIFGLSYASAESFQVVSQWTMARWRRQKLSRTIRCRRLKWCKCMTSFCCWKRIRGKHKMRFHSIRGLMEIADSIVITSLMQRWRFRAYLLTMRSFEVTCFLLVLIFGSCLSSWAPLTKGAARSRYLRGKDGEFYCYWKWYGQVSQMAGTIRYFHSAVD